MRLLLDENLSRRIVPFLQAEFPGSTQVALAGLERATDLAIWTYAKAHDFVIVTRDADFEELSTLRGCPPRVIWIRGENISKAAILNLLLTNRDVIEAALGEDGVACVELGANTGEPKKQSPDSSQRGFTLIELAIVLFVVGLLLGGMLLPLAGQQDIRNFGDTQKILIESRDALLGFAMANDRLPCPASDTSNGVEDPPGGGTCNHPYDGFLPAATLGLSPVDAQGYRLDGWGGEAVHRLRYAVSTSNTNAYTTQNQMKSIGMTTLATAAAGDLKICNTGTDMAGEGTAAAACDTTPVDSSLTVDAVAVIFSLGKNAGVEVSGDHEKHNSSIPAAVVAADPAFVNAPQGPTFDDQMLWLSKSALFNRMVAAGRLP